MSKTVVIHQPDFLPYLGFFQRLLFADLFVILDSIQFEQGGRHAWTHRDKIKTPTGEKWLSLSLEKVELETPICEVRLSKTVDWKRSNLNLLRQNYRQALFFGEVFPLLERLYAYETDMMAEFNLKSISMLMDLFDIRVPIVHSSQLGVQGKKNELLVDILKKLGADHYLSGVGAKAYFQPEPFAAANIEVVWQNFNHPVYPQQFGAFIPYLSSIDLLFNCGVEKSREILKGG